MWGMTVSKVFIFSDSIGTYTFLYTVEWFFGTNVDTIITTDEVVFKNVIGSFRYKFECYDSIEACVSNCDIVLVYDGKNLPEYVISKIKSISIIQSKRYIEVESYKGIETKDTTEYRFINGSSFTTPAVVIFSIGLSTVPMKVELDINRIFSDEGVSINQYLSLYSSHILQQLSNFGIAVNKIKSLSKIRCENVSTYFLDLNNNIFNIYKYYSLLTTIKPDYIIVLTDYDLSDYDEILAYIKCFCLRYPDVIVKSRWFSIGNDIFCHSDQFDNSQQEKKHFVLDFEDGDFLEKIKFDMFSKISLAEGIKRIQ